MAGEQTFSISQQINTSSWQTIGKIHFAHSSHERLPSTLSRRKCSTTLSIEFVPRLRLCWCPWGLKINFLGILYFWKSCICTNQLDEQEANICLSQFHRIGCCLIGCWTATGWIIYSRLMGYGNWSVTFTEQHKAPIQLVSGNRYETRESSRSPSKVKLKGHRGVQQFSQLNHVIANAHSQWESRLHVFEGNLAVIKMIIKGRRPTRRFVSGTRRVAVRCLLDRIDMYPRIHIEYVDTKNKLSDMLTKESFRRDEWNHLLHLLNIMELSIIFLQPLLAFVSKANRTECCVQKKARSIFRGKRFANGEAKSPNLWIRWWQNQAPFLWCHAKPPCRVTSPREKRLTPEAPWTLRKEKTVFALAFGKQMASTSPYPAKQPSSFSQRKQWRRFLDTRTKVKAHARHALGNRSRVLARIKLREILVPWWLQCITIWRKCISTYWKSWNSRVHQSKTWSK